MTWTITKNPKVMHGVPCFAGTRVPARSLFDYLEAGYSVDAFLEQFPSVSREQVLQVLEDSKFWTEEAAQAVG